VHRYDAARHLDVKTLLLTGYTFLYLGASALSALAAVFAYRIRRAPGGLWLFLLTISTGIWCLADAFDYSSLVLIGHTVAATFEYAGLVTPVFFLLFAIQYSGRARGPIRWYAIGLFVVPLGGVIAAATNAYHHLLWRGFESVPGMPTVVIFEHGPLFWVSAVYALGVALLATLLLVDTAARAHGIYRVQGSAIAIAAVVPWATGLAYLVFPAWFIGLDPTLAFAVTGVVLSWSLWHLKLLDLVLVPREVIVENLSDGLLVLDSTSRILEMNPAAARLLGFTKVPAPGTPLCDALSSWSQEGKDAFCAAKHAEYSTLASPSGGFVALERSHLEGEGPLHSRDLILLRDITAQVRAERALQDANSDLQSRMTEIERLHDELSEQATRDPLTGLHNRRYLAEQLDRELSRAGRSLSPISLIMLDIDHFKTVNDTQGHAAGDEVLRAIAGELLAGTRRCDIASRYGGDEFIVALPNATAEHAMARAEYWRERFARVMEVSGGGASRPTVSLGVATFPEHGVTMDALINAADNAVYAAKAAGRDRVCLASASPLRDADRCRVPTPLDQVGT
jgi:diguanylate cyclase (GGDEF)-like protein